MIKRLLLLFILFIPSVVWATVTGQNFSVSYTCSGTTGPFAFTFAISDATALTVTQSGTVLNSGLYNIVPINKNYMYGGSITLKKACPAGQPLVLTRITPVTQTTLYTNNMPLPMTTIMASLDKLTEIDQEQSQLLTNATCIPGYTMQSLNPLVCVQVGGPNSGLPLSGGTMTGPLRGPQIGNGVYASLMVGADCGAQVNAAIASTPTATIPIYVDASCGGNTATFSTPVTLDAGRVLRFVQYANYTMNAGITLGYASVVEGLPIASNGGSTSLVEGTGANLACILCMSAGSNSVIKDLYIDGNKANNSSALDGILVSNANRVHIYNVTVNNSKRDNIHITNTMVPTITASESLSLNQQVTLNVTGGGVELFNTTTPGTGTNSYPACASNLGATCTWGTAVLTNIGSTSDNVSGDGYLGPNVLIENAGRDGLFTERNADWIIDGQVEFETNGRDGLHCEDCATYRISNSDFGLNLAHGLYSAVVNAQCSTGIFASGHIIASTQFGANASGDIYSTGTSESGAGFCSVAGTGQVAGALTITGNAFISATSGSPNEDSITLVDSGGNTIAGNTFGFVAFSLPFRYLVNSSFSTLTGAARVGQYISGNNMVATAGGPIYSSAPFSLTNGIDYGCVFNSAGSETCYGNHVQSGALSSTTLSVGGGATISNTNAVPQIGTPTVNHGACIKNAGPPVVIGYCSTALDGSGVCTCN